MRVQSKRLFTGWVVALATLFAVIWPWVVQASPFASPTLVLAVTPTPAATVITGVVKRSANLRAGPGVNFARVGSVAANTQVVITGSNATRDWYQLQSGVWIAAFLVDQVAKDVPVVAHGTAPTPTRLSPTPTASAQTSNAGTSFTAYKESAGLGPWRMKVVRTRQEDSINILPDGRFDADEGYVVYLVELQLENTANVTSTLTVDPQQIKVMEQQGQMSGSIGVAPGPGDLFFLHIYHTGGSASFRSFALNKTTAIKLEVTAQDEKHKEWTIQLPSRSSSQLTLAFVVTDQTQVKELHWPTLPSFSLQPDTTSPLQTVPPTPTASAIIAPAMGKLTGRVFRSDINEPLVNATIEVNDATRKVDDPQRQISEVLTDSQGHYTVELKPGNYRLNIVVTASKRSALPCSDDPFGLVMTKAGWLGTLGQQTTTGLWVLFATGDQDLTIEAGKSVTKEIDLACR